MDSMNPTTPHNTASTKPTLSDIASKDMTPEAHAAVQGAMERSAAAQARMTASSPEDELQKARRSNIESIVHGALVSWGWKLATADEVQARITDEVVRYMNQYEDRRTAAVLSQVKKAVHMHLRDSNEQACSAIQQNINLKMEALYPAKEKQHG